jgi:hypothetical protein
MRTVLFDEVIFKEKCILFRIYDNIPDIGDLPYQHLDFPADRVDLAEIGTYPFLQVLRFPDINDTVLIVKILVNPRFLGQIPDDGLQVGKIFIQGS